MKILVCISKVPDTTAKISFSEDQTSFNSEGVQFIVNPADEWFALVRAIEIKEALGAEVHLISVGKSDYDGIIRKALALGADSAIRIDAAGKDGFYTASQIAHFTKDKGYDLILTGEATISHNNSSIGGMIAALLDIPFISLATHLELNDSKATATREIEGGEEICEVAFPAVISCSKGMAEQRIPNMRGIMMARKKPLEVIPPQEAETLTEVQKYELPPSKGAVRLIDPEHPEELVRLLHEEAKVI